MYIYIYIYIYTSINNYCPNMRFQGRRNDFGMGGGQKKICAANFF